MPDDYYVSQYSGEEIDERLTAAHNAVRYDAAQTLTDAQKLQARGNINAAPGGFGLGGKVATIPENANLNDYVLTGFWGNDYSHDIRSWVNTPANWPANEAILEVYAVGAYAIQRLSSVTTKVSAQRSQRNNAWDEWEWVNPPLNLGVEYRTTERYMNKPVYAKLIDCGNLPVPQSQKYVAHGVIGCLPIMVTAQMSNSNTIPWLNQFTISADSNDVVLYSPTDERDFSDLTAKAILKYIKTTD